MSQALRNFYIKVPVMKPRYISTYQGDLSYMV